MKWKNYHSHIHSIHTKADNYSSPSKTVLFLPTSHLPVTSTIQRKTFIVKCLCQTKVQKMAPNSFLSSQRANIIMRLESCKQTWRFLFRCQQIYRGTSLFKLFVFWWIPLISDIIKCIKMLQCGKKGEKINKYTTEMKADPFLSVFTHNALSSFSHGIKMEAMGLLSLLAVICFL